MPGRGSIQPGFLGDGEKASFGGRLGPTIVRRVIGQMEDRHEYEAEMVRVQAQAPQGCFLISCA